MLTTIDDVRHDLAQRLAAIKSTREALESGAARVRATDEVARGLPAEALEDAADVAAQGREIERNGIPYLLEGIIPFYGMLAFLVAFAKVGKTTFGQALAASIATGADFLDRATQACRVLVLAVEDPPEYTAYLARHLQIEPGRLVFYRRPLVLTSIELQNICATIESGGFGFVLIASWQAAIRGLIRDENDNAGAVQIVEAVKLAARQTGIPWLIDAHSGKGEDQADDADPSKAMRGASAAAAAADYTLSLRYANGTFGTQRRLSGKGRFVSFEPITLNFDTVSSTYSVVGATKDALRESTWRLIAEADAINGTPRSANEIARVIFGEDGKLSGNHRKRVSDALRGRPEVLTVQEMRRGQKTTLYRLGGES
jgi:hypothetical protein